MQDKIKEYKLLEQQMLTMRKFFIEYFRKTINKNGIGDEADFTFLELKGLAAFTGDDPEFTMSELSTTLYLPLPNITSIINKLEKKKVVERHRDSKDRRIIKVRLTTMGKNMRNKFMKKRIQEVEHCLGRLSTKDRKDLCKALKLAADIFRKIQYR
ncbi:MAG: MarR family winged helix-turn-helix transcriptional regulator [Proteobacteria bacterium]|nr:MarR family winged helix-turn-helix transcriptional regulator [Pseudomonadota bacterium]